MPIIPDPYPRADDADAAPAPDAPAPPATEDAHLDAQAQAKTADMAVTGAANQVLYDGGQPFMGLTGEAAVRAAPQALEAVGQAYDQAASTLTPHARAMLGPVFAERMAGWRGDIVRHAEQQRQAALDQVSQARQDMALGEVRRYASADPARAEANLRAALSEIRARGERQGLAPDQVGQAMRRTEASAWSSAIGDQLATDPRKALSLLDARQGQLDPATATALRPQVEGEARRLETERQVDGLVSARLPAAAPDALAILPADAHPPLDVQALTAEAMAQAGPQPERQAAAGLYAQAQAVKLNAQRARAIRAATAKAQPYLSDPAVASLSQIPADVRLALPASTREALTAHFAAGGHPPSTDEEAHASLYDLLSRAPDRFLDLDLTGASTRFERHDYQKLLADQATLSEGGPAAQALTRTTGQAIAAADAMLADIGVTPETAPGQAAAARSSVLRAVDAAQAANDGKPLDAQAIAKAAADTALAPAWPSAAAMKPRPGMMGARYFLPAEDGADEGGGESEDDGDGDADDNGEQAAPSVTDSAEPAAARVPTANQAAVAGGGLEKATNFNPPPEGALDPVLKAMGVPTARDDYFAKEAAKMRDLKMTPEQRDAFGKLQRDANAAPSQGRRTVTMHPGEDISELSRAHESGGDPGRVSSGTDRGGVSYGIYQLATKYGQPAEFLAHEGAPWASRFGDTKPPGKEFGDIWKKIAVEDPVAFGRAQFEYAKRHSYEVQANKILARTGMDVGARSRALRNIVFSAADQHGENNDIIVDVIRNLKKANHGQLPADGPLIDAIQAERGRKYANGKLVHFRTTKPSWWPGLSARFLAEREEAQKILQQESGLNR